MYRICILFEDKISFEIDIMVFEMCYSWIFTFIYVIDYVFFVFIQSTLIIYNFSKLYFNALLKDSGHK